MHYETYPKCCGIAIIQDLGGSGEWWDHDERRSKKDLKDTFDLASDLENQYAMILVALNTRQLAFYKGTLEELGFEELKRRRNPKSGRDIFLYCWTRPTRSWL